MTKFNPENKETMTYGECLGPAMEITDPEDAQQYLTEYVNHIQKYLDAEPRDDDMTAEQIAKTNLGYYAGYGSSETRVCPPSFWGNKREGTTHPRTGI